jgi:protein SCO1/2
MKARCIQRAVGAGRLPVESAGVATVVMSHYHRGRGVCLRRLSFVVCALLFVPVMAVTGCRQSGSAPASTSGSSAYPVKTFPVSGKIIETDATHVTLEHGDVPGFMGAMTMMYKLKDPSIVSELHPGDRITATIVVEQDAAGFKNPQLDHIVIVAQAKPDYVPKVQYHVPAAGDTVPDFKLLNQNAKAIHLDQFKGQVVLATFIFTRCQMGEFCPRMSSNFAAIDKTLAADPALYAKTHLLSISFDPTYDTPAVLKKYGAGYMKQGAKESFAHWDFAAPSDKDLPAVEQFFDLGVQGSGAQTTHSLSTVVIGKDGKVVAFYPTNDWTTDEVLAAVKAAA